MAAEGEEVTGRRQEDGGRGGDIHQAVLVCVCQQEFSAFLSLQDKMFSQGCEDEDVKMCHSAASTRRSGLRFGVRVEMWWMKVEAVLKGIRRESV